MKTCICGGKMYRHTSATLKDGTQKMRFKCIECGCHESYYRACGEDEWKHEHRKAGRPCEDDSVFRRAA